jgi:hypothetical protein
VIYNQEPGRVELCIIPVINGWFLGLNVRKGGKGDENLCGYGMTVEATRHLLSASFQQLSECGEWALHPGGRYFFTHNMSSVFAFAVGSK